MFTNVSTTETRILHCRYKRSKENTPKTQKLCSPWNTTVPSLHFSRQQRKLENVSEADKYKRETAGWDNSKPVVIRDGLATIVTSLIYFVYYRASSHRISATVLVRHYRERGTHSCTHTYTPLCSQFTFPFLNQYFLCLLSHPSLFNGNSAATCRLPLEKKKEKKKMLILH